MNRFLSMILMTAALSGLAHAQLGRQQGLIDPNIAAEKDLLAVPNLTPALVKGILEQRPFANIVAMNDYLAKSLSKDQLNQVYGKAFLHVNLNTGTPEEILLIPGAGARMVREFREYRPWKTYEQFRKEIGKYVDEKEVARLEQYTFIAISLNNATDADILSVPGAGTRMVREFKEYRPWKDMATFRKEIGKYVNPKEVGRLERYVILP